MAWFRNTDNGREFSMDERWAEHVRGSAGVVETDGPGGAAMAPPPPEVIDGDPELASVRKSDLQTMCREAGLSDAGTKAEMVERLRIAPGPS